MTWPNGMAFSVPQGNPAGRGVNPISATSPNLATQLGSILSEAGNNAAYHAADALQWFGHTFGGLNALGSMDGLTGGKEKKGPSGMSSPVPFSQFGKFRPLSPLLAP